MALRELRALLTEQGNVPPGKLRAVLREQWGRFSRIGDRGTGRLQLNRQTSIEVWESS
ncbi:hypothetical protein GA0061091_11991 [Gordonia sp. v-85]|nr:hypothetical protein GA0061091_11991 [Gordonia sp. v-85]